MRAGWSATACARQCSERREGLVWSGLPGGFRAGRRCWSCPAGVRSRDGTAGLGRTVWSTTNRKRTFRRATTRVAAEGSSGARGDRGPDRFRLLRQASLEAALSPRADMPGWALTLDRARILRSAVQRRGNWRNAAHAFGRQRNAGYRRTGGGNVPTGFGLRPGAKGPDEPPTPHHYAPPVDSTKVVRTRVRQLRGPHLSTCA